MAKRYANRRSTRRRAAVRARMRTRTALLAAMAALVAALAWLALSAKPAEWLALWGIGREETAYAGFAEPLAARATPAPLSIAVRETELVAETVALHAEAAPRVLIYHTHASEAYLPTQDEPYEASGSWRTLDNERNVVAIGALLQETLLKAYGVTAVHDRENYEEPKLATAYNRSLIAMERHLKENPTIELFVDLHRDAYGLNEENQPQDFIELEGKQVARVMLVVGTGEGATGSGFPELPDVAANMRLAERITDRLRASDERLARDIRVKTGRYNQHVSDSCILVEVGHTANTLAQAKNAVPYLAEAIAEIVKSAPAPDALSTMRVWTP